MEKILKRYWKEDMIELIDSNIKSLIAQKLMMFAFGADRCEELVIASNGGISALMVLRDEVSGETVDDFDAFIKKLTDEVLNDEEDEDEDEVDVEDLMELLESLRK